MIDEIRSFKRTEVLIEEYAKILRAAALMIRSHLDHISPMPPELIELLRHQMSAPSLKNCITVLEFNATSLISKRDQLRSELANADVSEAASICQGRRKIGPLGRRKSRPVWIEPFV
ncbi:hypothetical protein [Celeribacter ethanolicus]|uniref:hypothetical protein n=1 Tax=Celeribacter ethanolicus TaxID=1758178 RepID=UPI0012FE6606|nr:hypothetical protein [Celeribacter ethanolicus]